MKKKTIFIAIAVGVVAGVASLVLFHRSAPRPVKETAINTARPRETTAMARHQADSAPVKAAPLKRTPLAPTQPFTDTEGPWDQPDAYAEPEDLSEADMADEMDYPKDIETIKKQIYDLNIEFVEDLPLLDSVVQTGDAETKGFWQGGWVSVDDFKREDNGFELKPQEDGTYLFNPDLESMRKYTFFETPQSYTYDPQNKEFVWKTDYYGKTITHKAKFINDNVLAMMLISGRKVTLNIYEKEPDELR